MIVVEGVDGSGKSTLVRRIQEEFGLKEGARGTKNRDLLYQVTLPDTMRALACAVQGSGPPFVWDRLFYSDYVYAPMQGRDIAFSIPQGHHITKMIGALKCPVIVCMPPWAVVEANALKDHQMDGVKENLRDLYERYQSLLLDPTIFPSRTMLIRYDYTRHHENVVLDPIGSYLRKRKERSI